MNIISDGRFLESREIRQGVAEREIAFELATNDPVYQDTASK